MSGDKIGKNGEGALFKNREIPKFLELNDKEKQVYKSGNFIITLRIETNYMN